MPQQIFSTFAQNLPMNSQKVRENSLKSIHSELRKILLRNAYFFGNSQKVRENSLIWVRCVKILLLFYYRSPSPAFGRRRAITSEVKRLLFQSQ